MSFIVIFSPIFFLPPSYTYLPEDYTIRTMKGVICYRVERLKIGEKAIKVGKKIPKDYTIQ